MFKDYYEILGVGLYATDAEVKSAYRQQAAKWHPDRNPGRDVTDMMININEAYEILGNPVTRKKYNKEYLLFKQVVTERHQTAQGNSQAHTGVPHSTYSYDYNVSDNDLNNDINNARAHARSKVSELMSQLKSDTRIAAEGAWENSKYLIYWFIFGLIVSLLIVAFSGQ